MSKQLKQVINLSKKTGDRIIVFDNSEPDNSFVVMTLDQYENIMGLESESLTDKKIIDKMNSNESNNGKSNNWRISPRIKEESEE